MSELERDNAKTLDDVETDSIEAIEEDTDETVQVAEMMDRTSFQAQLRAFFGLFTIVRDQITLKIIDDDKWEKQTSSGSTSGASNHPGTTRHLKRCMAT